MKKLTWIIIGIVVVAIIVGGIYYFKNYYPYSGNAGQITERDLYCGSYYGQYNYKKIGTPDNWVHGLEGTKSALWHAPDNWQHPLSCDYNETLVGGCAGVQNIYWQECCDNWAQEKNISHIQCVGSWTVENNTCKWECGVKDIVLCTNDSECSEDLKCLRCGESENGLTSGSLPVSNENPGVCALGCE